MSILGHIKKKGSDYIENLKKFGEEDPFAVSIDPDYYCDSAVSDAKEIIPPGDDDGYGDEPEGIMSN